LPLAGPITKSELMALASVSPTVAGSKPKKLLDQTRDVLRWKSARPANAFESCETVSIAESAQCCLVRWPAQLVLRDLRSHLLPLKGGHPAELEKQSRLANDRALYPS
jgi:hypothetical protein